MECSSLNAHLHKKNIVPSSSCSCGGYESTYHFIFKCPNYSQIRNRYLPNNLNDLNTNDLIHGKSNLSETENESSSFKSSRFYTEFREVCLKSLHTSCRNSVSHVNSKIC